MKSDVVSIALGRGIIAGVIGTAAMTVSSTIEMQLRQREGSTTPAQAAGKVLGVTPRSDEAAARFSNLMHWTYGTAWGVPRGMLGVTGLKW
ncbi:MAG: hypothetical protein HC893_02155 [Chloroflexaceae bacterium]|nr:hypothetical protein [Chloroflexaceae bacterium]NJO06985.1 hypothetical protein [Chloroflexaceae bacterium]